MINVPLKFNFAKYVFELNIKNANKIAFLTNDTSITYKELELRSRGFAKSLAELGLVSQDRVVISLVDSIEFTIAVLGCILVGVVVILINPRSAVNNMTYCIKSSNAKLIISSNVSLKAIEEIIKSSNYLQCLTTEEFNRLSTPSDYEPATTDYNAPAYWGYTSGVSNTPKAAMHSHTSMFTAGYYSGQKTFNFTKNDIIFSISKLNFTYGLNQAFCSTLVAGATTVLIEKMGTVRNVIEILKTHSPTILVGVPSTYLGLLKAGISKDQTQSLRFCMSAGERLPVSIIEKWQENTLIPLYDSYGTTELGPLMTNSQFHYRKGTVGKLIEGIDAEIRDADNNVLPVGDIGDLYIRGITPSLGYYNDPERNKSTFQDQWTSTGDKFVLDNEGYFSFVGRSNEMFKVNGNWVSPVEVENMLINFDSIQEAAVVGKINKDGLTEIVAFVVAGSVYNTDKLTHQLKTSIRKKLDYFKCPSKIIFKKELPRNFNGKLQRYLLQQ
jgi:benzoate-CoA ligase